jgi:hypothetical protein
MLGFGAEKAASSRRTPKKGAPLHAAAKKNAGCKPALQNKSPDGSRGALFYRKNISQERLAVKTSLYISDKYLQHI